MQNMKTNVQEFFDVNYWKNFFSSPTKKRLTENFLSLLILQGLNYILSLVTFPYLVRILGPEKFGLIAFAQAFVAYFQILTDYGFNLSATREISINRENKQKVNEIFSSVMTVKLFLCLLSFLILSIFLIFIPKFRNDWLIYIFTFGMVLGNVLFPVWFFQGMEQMRYITILHIIAKTIFTISIFVFVKKMSDYLYVPLINSLGYLTAGILSLWVVHKNFAVKFILPTIKAVKHQFKEGWHIFVSIISTSLYTTTNTFVLGLFTNNTIVGYYSAGEKIVKALIMVITPLAQTFYPYISRVVQNSKESGIRVIKKLLFLMSSLTFAISLVIFIFANHIANILLGFQYRESIIVIKILSFLPFIISFNNVFGMQTMLSFGFHRVFSKIFISAAITNLFLVIFLIPLFHHVGAALANLIVESYIPIAMFFYLRKVGIKIIF